MMSQRTVGQPEVHLTFVGTYQLASVTCQAAAWRRYGLDANLKQRFRISGTAMAARWENSM